MKLGLEKNERPKRNSLILNIYKPNDITKRKTSNLTSRRESNSMGSQSQDGQNESSNHSGDGNYTLLNNILVYYHKGEFNRLFKLIESIDQPYDSFFYWQTIYIKILSYQKIIQYKIYKYFKEEKINKLKKYFSIFINDIQEIITNLNKINSNKKNNEPIKRRSFLYFKVESIKDKKRYLKQKNKIKKIIPDMADTLITLLLSYCYHFAKFCIYKNNINDCFLFLSLGVKLIQQSFRFVSSPESLMWSGYICLFISSLSINYKIYSTAKNYIIFVIIMCYIGLDVRLNINNDKINYFSKINYDSHDEKYINRIYFLLSIAFYHFGICLENENNIPRAISLYQQSKYFERKITSQDVEESDFDLFIDNIINRLSLRQQLISFFNSEEKNKTIVNEEIKKPKVILEKFENLIEIKKEKKFEKVKKFLENLKVTELDDDEPDLLNKVRGKPFSPKVGIPTKNIHIFNYFLSNKFNDFLKKENKLEINNLTPESKLRIQREIRMIKREEFEKYLSSKKKQLSIQIDNETKNSSKNLFYNRTNNYINSIKLRRFNNFNTINNSNTISPNKLLIKNFSKKSIIKNSILNSNSKENIVEEQKNHLVPRQMSVRMIPKISLFKNNLNRGKKSIFNQLTSNQNSSFISFQNSTKKSFHNSYFDSKINKNSININLDVSNSQTKIETWKKKLSIFSPKMSKKSKIYNLKSFLINNSIPKTVDIDNDRLISKKKFQTESTSNVNEERKNVNINSRSNLKRNIKLLNKSKSQMIRFDKNIFNKKLNKKKNFLDSQYVRELKFQKNFLKCKSVEFFNYNMHFGLKYNILNDSFNKQKVCNDCDNFYNKKIEEFMNKINIPSEKEQLNMVNKKLKIEEKEESQNILSLDSFDLKEKRMRRRGGIKENFINRNYFFLEKLMFQIDRISGKQNSVDLKLKELRDAFIIKNKRKKRNYLFSNRTKI